MSSSEKGEVIRIPMLNKSVDKDELEEVKKKTGRKYLQIAGGAVTGSILTDLLFRKQGRGFAKRFKNLNRKNALGMGVGGGIGALLPTDIQFSQKGVAQYLVRNIMSTDFATAAEDWKRIRGRGGSFGGEYSGEAGKILKNTTLVGRTVADLSEYNSRKQTHRNTMMMPRGFKVTEEGPGTVRITAPTKGRGRRKKYEWEKSGTQKLIGATVLAGSLWGAHRFGGAYKMASQSLGGQAGVGKVLGKMGENMKVNWQAGATGRYVSQKLMGKKKAKKALKKLRRDQNKPKVEYDSQGNPVPVASIVRG